MKKLITKIYLAIIFIFMLLSCNDDENPITPENTTYPKINTFNKSIEYRYLSTAPFYKQSTILCKYNSELFRFGTQYPLQIFNLENKSWFELPLEDNSFSRWDGAALNINDVIYLVAVSNLHSSFDILKFNPVTKIYSHTGINLPANFDYPAYCQNNESIFFLSIATDSVYKFNTIDLSLNSIAKNPFYNEDLFLTFSSGSYNNYFYVFGSNIANEFYRLNLTEFTWERLSIPKVLEKKYLFGSSLQNQMVLFADSLSAYIYNYDSEEWFVDSSDVPIFYRNLLGELQHGEWSFYLSDSCLYGSEVWSQKIWQFSIK